MILLAKIIKTRKKCQMIFISKKIYQVQVIITMKKKTQNNKKIKSINFLTLVHQDFK